MSAKRLPSQQAACRFVGGGGRIQVWDFDTGNEMRELAGHTLKVNCVLVSPDGTRLYSGSYDSSIIVWNLKTGKELAVLRGHTESVNAFALSADGKRLLSGSSDRTVKVWDLEAGKEVLSLSGHVDGWNKTREPGEVVRHLALSADGKRLFVMCQNGTIRPWDFDAGK